MCARAHTLWCDASKRVSVIQTAPCAFGRCGGGGGGGGTDMDFCLQFICTFSGCQHTSYIQPPCFSPFVERICDCDHLSFEVMVENDLG